MTAIEWTDATWNPVTGCTKVSPGCAHCYAETFAERFRGLPGHPFEQGFDLKLWPERLAKPFTWKKPRKVFVNSMSDLFHEAVPFEFIDRVFAVMALTPQHTYQVLTKRPERMREYLTTIVVRDGFSYGAQERIAAQIQAILDENPVELIAFWGWPLPNVWLGTSTENQYWADIRIPELLATPAAVRFLSCEPLLGPLDLRHVGKTDPTDTGFDALYCDADWEGTLGDATIDWVIVGGESGPKARPFDLAWIRSIVAQCKAAGTACFVKQLGAKPYTSDLGALAAPLAVRRSRLQADGSVHYNLRDRKGGNPDEWAEDLRVREWPV